MMFASVVLVRNILVYLLGIGCLVVGSLGLVEAISLSKVVAVGFFLIGLGLVLTVHELLDGPL